MKNKTILLGLFLSIFIFWVPFYANAGINQWTASGQIYGGIIRDIAINNDTIYVATRGNGIYYSEDGGENMVLPIIWAPIGDS